MPGASAQGRVACGQMTARRGLAPEEVAAAANAGVTLLLPCLFVALSWWRSPPSDAVPAGMSSAMWDASRVLPLLAGLVGLAMPFAAIAAWRTFVHAKCYLMRRDDWWQGLVEAAGLGATIPILVLGRAIVLNPMQAPPYVFTSGAMGFGIGLAFGVVLTLVALAVLRWTRGVERDGGVRSTTASPPTS